jgi:hypothetical protein
MKSECNHLQRSTLELESVKPKDSPSSRKKKKISFTSDMLQEGNCLTDKKEGSWTPVRNASQGLTGQIYEIVQGLEQGCFTSEIWPDPSLKKGSNRRLSWWCSRPMEEAARPAPSGSWIWRLVVGLFGKQRTGTARARGWRLVGVLSRVEAAGRRVVAPLPAALRACRPAASSRWPCALDEVPAAAGGWKAKYKAGRLLLPAPGLEELLSASPGGGSWQRPLRHSGPCEGGRQLKGVDRVRVEAEKRWENRKNARA